MIRLQNVNYGSGFIRYYEMGSRTKKMGCSNLFLSVKMIIPAGQAVMIQIYLIKTRKAYAICIFGVITEPLMSGFT